MISKFAEVSPKAKVGKNTFIWENAQIREGAKIGNSCIISKGVYIDKGVVIGNNVKIQNYACIYHKTIVEDDVFIGPHVIITNDKYPRSVNPNGKLKTDKDWVPETVIIKKGAAIGAGSIVLPNITIGSYSMIGSGSVVTKNVKSKTLVFGTPAKFIRNISK